MKRTRYTVSLPGNHQAKFSDYYQAMAFARRESIVSAAFIEVSHASGLVGQFNRGKSTPEFAAHWTAAKKAG